METSNEHPALSPNGDRPGPETGEHDAAPADAAEAATAVAVLPRQPESFALAIPASYEVVVGQDGHVYLASRGPRNRRAFRVGGRQANLIIREQLRQSGAKATRADLAEFNDGLRAWAEARAPRRDVWFRVAQIAGGVEIAVYDDDDTRVRITPGRVELVTEGSDTLFFRTSTCKPLAVPAASGDLGRLKRYVNLDAAQFVLLVAWLTYTLAHPKHPTTKFLILVLLGGQGAGKTFLEQLAKRLLDPDVIGVQRFPGSARDLAIAAQGAHVLAYDNLRGFHPAMADTLCNASTGGSFVTRALYTNDEQAVLGLHCAIVLNGIHSFVDQPDLAQRCLPLHLPPIDESRRASEAELSVQLEADLPAIQRGLYEKTAAILGHLDAAVVTSPERMVDFARWLAAMELADGVGGDAYQSTYSDVLNEGQRDSLLDSLLGATVLQFAEKLDHRWSGTPAELLGELRDLVTISTERSRDWPQNPIALSKRLAPLAAGLLTQGIEVQFSRGRSRLISIARRGASK